MLANNVNDPATAMHGFLPESSTEHEAGLDRARPRTEGPRTPTDASPRLSAAGPAALMTLEIEPTLVEQAVFLAVRGDGALSRKLHRITDPLYALPAGPRRDEQFRRACLSFFQKLGLDGLVTTSIAERPVIGRSVGRCVVREAAGTKEESAELFVGRSAAAPGPRDRTLIIQLTPCTLLDSHRALPLLRRELLHVADMLDDDFDYRRESIDGLPPRQNLVRDRYRVLWDIYVEGRLTREGRGEEAWADRLRSAFSRTFREQGREPDGRAFDAVFSATNLTHGQLLEWAGSPASLPTVTPRPGQMPLNRDAAAAAYAPGGVNAAGSNGTREAADCDLACGGGRPGETCPLCGFSTFDWADLDGGESGLAAAIRTFRPDWSPAAGACRQCAETYAGMDACPPESDRLVS